MAPNVVDSAMSVPKVTVAGKKAAQSGKTKVAVVGDKVAVLSLEKPPFTLKDVKDAIPAHCFKPTLHESFGHLALDLLQFAAAIAAVLFVHEYVKDYFVPRMLLWTAYWAFQGVTGTGIWVIAHECGHGGFSTNQTINDIVGFILHSAFYVPYFSWQRSHSNHHHYTNNINKDEVFVPVKHDGKVRVHSAQEKNPVLVFLHLVGVLIFGWPLYLTFNMTAHEPNPGEETSNSHFKPSSNIFNAKDRPYVFLSVAGLVAWTGILVYLGSVFGYLLVFMLYFPVLLVVNGFLVSITFLQHSDKKLPHYENADWNWLRGALSTVDRTMGRFLDVKLHFIHSTHVCHHIFSKMPFYRSEEATAAMIKVLGPYYAKDSGNFAVALYNNFRDCNYLENNTGVLYWVEEHLSD